MTQNNANTHAPAWVFFTYVSFAASLGMIVFGIAMLPIDIWMRAFLFLGVLMLVQSCVIIHEDAA